MARFDQRWTKREHENSIQKFDIGRIYMAEVMDTRSVARAGDIKVWLYNSDIDKTDKTKWLTASYCSPFYGTAESSNNSKIDFVNNPVSFGMWFPMPYVGNKVFVFFPNIQGEYNNLYWFGCPMDKDKNNMLPGIPGQYFSDEHKPVTEINTLPENKGFSLTESLTESARAEYTPLVKALETQGLNKDKLRGYSTAGAKREVPSMCYGILTPLGNSFTIDDGWGENDNKSNWNQYGSSTNYDTSGIDIAKSSQPRYNAGFRFRTRNGTQVLISDDGNIYMINRDGTAWAEISDDGRLHGYAANSVDIASDGDINLHAKKMIRMEAEEGFVLKSNKSISIESSDINISAPHINTDSIMSIPEINVGTGKIETLMSAGASIKGTFEGSLQGTAFYATHAGLIPTPQVSPDIQLPDMIDPIVEEVSSVARKIGETSDTINSAYPSAEPYEVHSKNDSIPDLLVSNSPSSDEADSTTSYSNFVSNQVSEVCPVPVDTSSDTSIPKMNLSEHFTLADLCYSQTAKNKGINNVPDESGIKKLQSLCLNVLEKIWANYNQRVLVNSGYRGPALNLAVGGASSSQHCKCEAADVEISGLDNYDLACWIRDNLDFDQLILEFATGGGNNGWVHVSWKEGSLRHQCLTINKSGTRSGLIKT